MITPNQLTIFRILLAVACPFILISNRSFLSEFIVLIAFTVACITDWWDGYLARKKSMVTAIGKIADPIADKLLILGLMTVFAILELYAFEWVIVIFIREITVTFARLVYLKKGNVLPAEWAGKVKIGFQITSVYLTLLFLLAFDSHLFFKDEPFVLFAFQSAHYLGIFFATVLTVISGAMFFKRLREA
ncbi:MAG: CDP-diacylglycerol--glycerol-3-phosphate 3-phosphatidyltransferase [Omnitrophica bacterium RIFCSPHIGHO2_02_FULL_46_11]|nr:MAG: CDP-diacylglycerol--glycerol-3-phosphate 3-phosphatidyltransferase [Omnitrophica bacterium RIFCSPHIGHO2_02_FULL_46_11]OGW86357.1 MAG: CDP-diacylglycerol--glycerol-3-phosphate 3-phosphatidyltransferase [Omnitrophica bacterium RIFCSPLOWO2_01_FULL_45_10b]